jgi:hypothetical protein
MARDGSLILPEGPPDFWVEVWNDDNTHYITISTHGRFDAAVAAFERLIKPSPPMRVVMRKRAHVYRNYIPARLHNSYDRTMEYPQ